MCAIAVPENTADTELPFGITIFSLSDQEGEILGTAERFLQTQSIPFAVCGLHKKGFPLESQLTELKASYKESINTAPHYRLYRLDTVPEKPGMVYDDKKGATIAVEIYELPVVSIGAFLQQVKKPLCIGDMELSDGRIVKGFLCEEYGLANAKEMDEPFSALDPQTKADMQLLMRQIWQEEKPTVIFVTHDIEEAVFLSSKIYVLTQRPGTVKAEVPVLLPYDRDLSLKDTDEFIKLRKKVNQLIEHESLS
jgi:hypothetical protein